MLIPSYGNLRSPRCVILSIGLLACAALQLSFIIQFYRGALDLSSLFCEIATGSVILSMPLTIVLYVMFVRRSACNRFRHWYGHLGAAVSFSAILVMVLWMVAMSGLGMGP